MPLGNPNLIEDWPDADEQANLLTQRERRVASERGSAVPLGQLAVDVTDLAKVRLHQSKEIKTEHSHTSKWRLARGGGWSH